MKSWKNPEGRQDDLRVFEGIVVGCALGLILWCVGAILLTLASAFGLL